MVNMMQKCKTTEPKYAQAIAKYASICTNNFVYKKIIIINDH